MNRVARRMAACLANHGVKEVKAVFISFHLEMNFILMWSSQILKFDLKTNFPNECRHGVRSLRYNSMQNASEWDRRLKHALRAPLSEEGHVLRQSHKEYKNTIGNPKGLWVKICLSSCKCVQAFPGFEQRRYVLAPLLPISSKISIMLCY